MPCRRGDGVQFGNPARAGDRIPAHVAGLVAASGQRIGIRRVVLAVLRCGHAPHGASAPDHGPRVDEPAWAAIQTRHAAQGDPVREVELRHQRVRPLGEPRKRRQIEGGGSRGRSGPDLRDNLGMAAAAERHREQLGGMPLRIDGIVRQPARRGYARGTDAEVLVGGVHHVDQAQMIEIILARPVLEEGVRAAVVDRVHAAAHRGDAHRRQARPQGHPRRCGIRRHCGDQREQMELFPAVRAGAVRVDVPVRLGAQVATRRQQMRAARGLAVLQSRPRSRGDRFDPSVQTPVAEQEVAVACAAQRHQMMAGLRMQVLRRREPVRDGMKRHQFTIEGHGQEVTLAADAGPGCGPVQRQVEQRCGGGCVRSGQQGDDQRPDQVEIGRHHLAGAGSLASRAAQGPERKQRMAPHRRSNDFALVDRTVAPCVGDRPERRGRLPDRG